MAERQQAIDAAQAYASSVVPEAKGEAAKIMQDAAAYKDRVVALAQGKAARFAELDAAYKRSPQITRERLYLETMEDVLEHANKVIVASKAGSGGNVLYLPIGKLSGPGSPGADVSEPPGTGSTSASASSDVETVTVEGRRRGER